MTAAMARIPMPQSREAGTNGGPPTKIEAALIRLSGEIPAILMAPRLKVRYGYRWWLVWPS
jgi:hypothetical protein